MKINLIVITILIFQSISTLGSDNCGRSAVISHQKLLIDTNSSQKGDGLKYYIHRDKIASIYFDEYQKGTRIHWSKVVPGTVGSLLTLSGFIFNFNDREKRTLIISGLSLIAVNFLISKTLEFNNERNLNRAIEEYNKRNLPTIHFSPVNTMQLSPNNLSTKICPTILINYKRSF